MMLDDNELRRRFAQLRESDREHVPTFAETYLRPDARRISRVSLRNRALVLGAVAAVLVVAVWMARTSPFLHSETTPSIATWRAPTDVLLDTPGSELLGEMPALGASVLDKMIPTHSIKGT